MSKSEHIISSAITGDDSNQRNSIHSVRNTMPRKAEEWSATQKMRLPHKVGLPLGSGGGGDDSASGM